MKWWMKCILILLVTLGVIYVCGPSPTAPKYEAGLPTVPSSFLSLEDYIATNERQHHLRPDNEARIVWNDSLHPAVTDYAFVYLHGFSASQEEGNPAHRTVAKQFGANLYLSRLAEHGIDTSEQLLNFTADKYWESGKEALAIAKQLGKKVIIIATSTGGTLALKLAATFPNDIAGLILYSPNIAINDSKAWILNNHWGLQIARKVKDSYYNNPEDERTIYKQYWNKPYRLEAAVQLQELLETSMTEATFKAVHQPTLVLYYYKDEVHQDSVVKVSAIKEMFTQLGTANDLKKAIAMPNTGNHVLGSSIKSNDVNGVIQATNNFLSQVMHLKPL